MEFAAKIVVKVNPKWRQVEEMLDKAVRIAAFTIERTSKEDCPVDTGATRNSITAREILRVQDKIRTIISKHTGQAYEKVARDTDRDFYLPAEQAQVYGLVDEVLGEPLSPHNTGNGSEPSS